MSLDKFNVVRPNQALGAGDPLALAIEEYTGLVEGTIQRNSILSKWIPMRTLKGTTTAQNYAVGGAQLQAIVPGQTPDGHSAKFNKNSVTVDTHILARHYIPELDTFQTQYDARAELAREQGEQVARFLDQAFLIQAAKAAESPTSSYGDITSFAGGSTATLSGSESDPAVVESALLDLYKSMAQKDVDVTSGDFLTVLTPTLFFALLESERVINMNYVTSKGRRHLAARRSNNGSTYVRQPSATFG